MDGTSHPSAAPLPQVPLRMEQGLLAARRHRALCGGDDSGHRGNPAPPWDGIQANGGVPPQPGNRTTRNTVTKANKIRASANQRQYYGMLLLRP